MNNNYPLGAVALFIRHPIPGRVKTRLAKTIGDLNACSFYEAMVSDVLSNIKKSGLPLFLFHDGSNQEGLPEEWINAANGVYKQEGYTLDERMRGSFERLYATGIDKVILIGSDIPGIDAEILKSASDALNHNDAVFAPAFDGGYCLVGLRKDSYNARIFCDIPWSTERVLSITMDRCAECRMKVTLLKTLQDIDTVEDLENYCKDRVITATNCNGWIDENAAQSFGGLKRLKEIYLSNRTND